MRQITFTLLWVLFTSAAAQAAEAIQWHGNFRAAQACAAYANLSILLHFTADWCGPCGPCERLDRDVFPLPQLARLINHHVVTVKVDVDRQPRLAKKFGVMSVPTDVYLSADGQLLSSGPSPGTVDEYLSTLRQLISRDQHASMTKGRRLW